MGKGLFKGAFLCKFESAQRCERMNAYLNSFLKTHLKLFEFLKHFDWALSCIHHNDAKAKFEMHTLLLLLNSKLHEIEKYTDIVFTRKSFLKFRDEMNAKLFSLISTKNHRGYHVHTLTKFRSSDKFSKVCYGNCD